MQLGSGSGTLIDGSTRLELRGHVGPEHVEQQHRPGEVRGRAGLDRCHRRRLTGQPGGLRSAYVRHEIRSRHGGDRQPRWYRDPDDTSRAMSSFNTAFRGFVSGHRADRTAPTTSAGWRCMNRPRTGTRPSRRPRAEGQAMMNSIIPDPDALTADDIAGAQALYGAGVPPTSCSRPATSRTTSITR